MREETYGAPGQSGDRGPRYEPGNGETRALEEDIELRRENLGRTLAELEDRFSVGDLLEQGLSLMRSHSGGVVHSVSDTVRQNPLPVAMIGAGLAWLMLGKDGQGSDGQVRSGQVGDEFAETDSFDGIPRSEDFADVYAMCLRQEFPFDEDQIACLICDDLGEESLERYIEEQQRQAAKISPAYGGARLGGWDDPSASSDEPEFTRKYRFKERLAQARTRLGQGTDEARDRLARARENAWRRAQRARASFGRQAEEARTQAGEFVDRYPLSLVLLGAAAGAALGTTLPQTEEEHRLMGRSSDKLKRKGGAMLREQREKAQRAATAARDAAGEEARAQGLDAEHARGAGGQASEKVRRVGAAAAEAARSEGRASSGTA